MLPSFIFLIFDILFQFYGVVHCIFVCFCSRHKMKSKCQFCRQPAPNDEAADIPHYFTADFKITNLANWSCKHSHQWFISLLTIYEVFSIKHLFLYRAVQVYWRFARLVRQHYVFIYLNTARYDIYPKGKP